MTHASPPEIYEVLKATALFGAAPDEVLRELVGLARFRRVAAGEVLFMKNAAATAVYIVLEGRIRISSIARDGSEFLIGMVEVGQLFGELALIDDSRRTVTAVAEHNGRLLTLERRHLVPVVESNLACALGLAKVLAGHVRSTIDKLESVALYDAKHRIWFKLRSLGRHYGAVASEEGALRIDHGLSQQQLANSVGLTRVMVSRQLGFWRDKALVTYGRGWVEIRDPEALEAMVWREWEREAAE